MTAKEIERIGERVFAAYWPDRLYNHDAEKPAGLTEIGTTDAGGWWRSIREQPTRTCSST